MGKRKGLLAVALGLAAAVLLGVLIMDMGKPEEILAADPETERLEKARLKIEEADKQALGYYYDEAIATLTSDPTLINKTATEDAISIRVKEIEDLKAALVKYEGPGDHIFFHSLIVYPELAFDGAGHPAKGYNMWMTTASEFKRMLPRLYERGYVLYPLNEYIENDPENPGNIKLKDIYLPPGKKPLVISVDDVNYYDYMKPDGFADRLVIGDDGRVWTEVITPSGETLQTRDGDVMPILDDFVAEHPDFSWRGAKGVMAVTGYQGALGYRITDSLPEEANWQQEVKKIADIMKADGWIFACHSYTHNGYFRDGTVTMNQMVSDTQRWKERIAPWVGDTNIYISPFGWHYNNKDAIHRYVAESGFQIFCPVDISRSIKTYSDIMIMSRVNLDGYTMAVRPEFLKEHYMDVDGIWDPARPKPDF